MAEAKAQQYHGLLEIISRVNHVVDQNKAVDETLAQIIETLQVLEDSANPVSTRIVFGQREFKTHGFKVGMNCRERSFKTFSGRIGHFQICLSKKESNSLNKNKTEQFFFINNIPN